MDPTLAPPIHDLWIQSVDTQRTPGETRWVALRDSDHVLYRLGIVEVHRLQPGGKPAFRVRAMADEVWCLLEGKAEFNWRDLRADSPTRDREYRQVFEAPMRALAPFGVAFGIRAVDGEALLLRLATHADDDPASHADRRLAWEADR